MVSEQKFNKKMIWKEILFEKTHITFIAVVH